MMLRRYIAPKEFYKNAGSIAVPLAMQSMLASCMGIVDSLMVSWIGMVSAVGTAAQLDTLAATVAYGAVGGTVIFTAQFYGAKDMKNLKRTFGFSLVMAVLNGLIFLTVSILFGKSIIKFYIDDTNVIFYGYQYLKIVAFSFLPASISFAFSYIYRAVNKTKVPLYIGILAMVTNCSVNYILIFGKLGLPAMGVRGAAVGTVVAQYLAMIIHIIYAVKTKQVFMGKFKELFCFDGDFIYTIMNKIFPLIFNEILFGFGSTLFIKAFGFLGTRALDAYYVGNKINDVFVFIEIGISNACSVIVGNTLGTGDIKKAKKEGDYFVGVAVILAIASTILIFLFSSPLVAMFKLKDLAVIQSANTIVKVFSIKIALRMFIVIVFSTLRAGGDSKMLTLIDSGIMYVVGLPLAFFVVRYMNITEISVVFLIIQIEQVIRAVLGIKRYNSGAWAVNLVTNIDNKE